MAEGASKPPRLSRGTILRILLAILAAVPPITVAIINKWPFSQPTTNGGVTPPKVVDSRRTTTKPALTLNKLVIKCYSHRDVQFAQALEAAIRKSVDIVVLRLQNEPPSTMELTKVVALGDEDKQEEANAILEAIKQTVQGDVSAATSPFQVQYRPASTDLESGVKITVYLGL